MELNHYQKQVLRTANAQNNDEGIICNALGVAGEAGEVADIVKKWKFHNHETNPETIAKELGDVLWYVAALAHNIDYSLDKIAEMNLHKLQLRYPNGFNEADSKARVDVSKS